MEKGHNDIVRILLSNDADTELATKVMLCLPAWCSGGNGSWPFSYGNELFYLVRFWILKEYECSGCLQS